MIKGLLLIICSVFIASVSQILLKYSANHNHVDKIREYLNPFVIVGYTLLLITTILTIFAYKYIPISIVAPMDSLGQVFVPILSCIFLKESITHRMGIGIFLIIIGVIIAVMQV